MECAQILQRADGVENLKAQNTCNKKRNRQIDPVNQLHAIKCSEPVMMKLCDK